MVDENEDIRKCVVGIDGIKLYCRLFDVPSNPVKGRVISKAARNLTSRNLIDLLFEPIVARRFYLAERDGLIVSENSKIGCSTDEGFRTIKPSQRKAAGAKDQLFGQLEIRLFIRLPGHAVAGTASGR